MPVSRQSKRRSHSTTIRIPERLYREATAALRQGSTEAGSFNELVIEALEIRLRQLRRERIDAAFEGMSGDESYHRLAREIADEFAFSDYEALLRAEKP